MYAENFYRNPTLGRVEQFPCYIHAADLSLPEHQLNKPSDKVYYNEPGQGSQHTEVIRGSLSIDWLSPLVSARWKNSVDQHGLQNGPASSEHGPILGLVERLFNLLPALEAARRAYSLQREKAKILEAK